MIINAPEVIAELSALYPLYENALVTNDVDSLVSMFWDAPQVMRFGATENLYGPEELEALRKARPAANLARTVTRLDIVSFGRDFASITLEFERNGRDGLIRGRQSQTWVRLEQGWRIVSQKARASAGSVAGPMEGPEPPLNRRRSVATGAAGLRGRQMLRRSEVKGCRMLAAA